MQFKTWQEFFDLWEFGEIPITHRRRQLTLYIEVEELYQHFKARLMDDAPRGYTAAITSLTSAMAILFQRIEKLEGK